MRKRIRIAVALIVGLIIAAPWLIYWAALWNVEGQLARPRPPYLSKERTQRLWACLGQKRPVFIQSKSPPAMAIGFLTGNISAVQTSGDFVAWQVARHHNLSHLKNNKGIYRHAAGAALTVWLTRNWSADEILTAADKAIRSYPARYRCLRRTKMTYE